MDVWKYEIYFECSKLAPKKAIIVTCEITILNISHACEIIIVAESSIKHYTLYNT